MCGYFCIRFINFVLKGKSLTDLSNLFSANNFKDNDEIILKYIKMVELSNIYPNLIDQEQFRLN